MKKNVIPFNLIAELNDQKKYSTIENDIILFETKHIEAMLDYPFKIDVILLIVCLQGTAKGSINLKPYVTQSPCFILLPPNQILQQESISEDFNGLFIVFSQRFAENLLSQIQDKFPLFFSTVNKPVIPLDIEQLIAVKMYYRMMKRVIGNTQNPYRLESAKHLTMLFFYTFGSWMYKSPEQIQSKQEMLVKNFLNLVHTHCKEERGLNFYADKLHITPKHLSKVIKENSNMSAAAWIDNSVVLEAWAMLKSTNMTIQQISDELNFPSQSFFGKFFKRVGGMSPKEYRGK
ncbi:MAG: Arabinose operon regulatory protein [Candidatus Ordinivivax streblomastigis]|uniref:Arabinose operon regulatory protein n=1 Tax=Candidatus Ordinivivax streblomastigis TaxID=2540710 RepID=A0A5M8NZX3_9BACT|nr:MAG: Arabinose operon regulatory protein [Candidatus Ordinivivax streblomastigis]